MKQTIKTAAILVFFCGVLGAILLLGQKSPRDILGKLADKIDSDSLFKAKPVLTTSLADALTGVPFLDGFDPAGGEPLSLQPRGSGGTFRVSRGGIFLFEAESFCLHAGSRGPGRGEGYLQAPLKGARAGIIRSILFRAADHPEIPQADIQVLIWAILARSRIDLESGKLLKTARVMLTPHEIIEANGGALGLVPDDALDKMLARVPSALQAAFRAEAELRNALNRADATYEELERIAIPGDDEAAEDDPGPVIPRSRWSYNRRGYFIRYFHRNYSRAVIEIYVPEAFTIERDSRGRVTAIAHPDGERIELEYGATGAAATPGDAAVSAATVAAIRLAYVYPKDIGRIVKMECPAPGWTLAGVPAGAGKSLPGQESFPGLAERYEASRKHKAEIEALASGLRKAKQGAGGIQQGRWATIMSLYHAVEVLKLAHDKLSPPAWMTDPVELATRAWQSELAGAFKAGAAGVAPSAADAAESGRGPSLPLFFSGAAGGAGEDNGGFGEIDLSPDGGQPGDPGEQRQGYSNRGTPENEKCDGEYGGCKNMAWREYEMCFADCLMLEEKKGPLIQCTVTCRDKYNQDMKDCTTLVRHCKGL